MVPSVSLATALCFVRLASSVPSPEPTISPYNSTTTTTTTTSPPTTSTTPSPVEGKIWVLLVAGSKGFYNYRHQADICHAYQIIHASGIPDENIIVMMYDDIANNDDNVFPGKIFNRPGGSDVYKGVPKDYTLDDVNPKNFINILKGNKEALAGIGSGRVIESGPNDHIFINFVDHGGPGVLYFPNEELMADELISNITEMAYYKKFGKLVLYVEACFAGSMFQNLLKDNLNVFVTTASDPYESSYACYYDDSIGTYLGDVFSVNWMEDTEKEDLTRESLNRQFEIVRAETKTSHVEEYGDLDLGITKLSSIIGYQSMRNRMWNMKNEKSFVRFKDAVPSIQVPNSILQRKLDSTKGAFDRMELKMKLHVLKQNIYITTHLSKFVNFCNMPWTRLPVMLNAINKQCSKENVNLIGLKNVI
ncbi:hypothetical protein LSTR_LSTR004110 [Laodelphax striatellus]|uniref:legumain n=1 Tax=Laodelphax striatellus TaxID=195883 RepID=A0A482WHC8_LAOST|nr:hypothetical protein LSTR_LSTR004110 [Laodelphax striatellus]